MAPPKAEGMLAQDILSFKYLRKSGPLPPREAEHARVRIRNPSLLTGAKSL
jgi:hypothetical protein